MNAKKTTVVAADVQTEVATEVVRSSIHAPFGRSGSTNQSGTTELSMVQGGRYINVYPGAEALELMKDWQCIDVHWDLVNGKPDAIRLQPTDLGYRLRSRNQQRQHLVLPTVHVGGLAQVRGMQAAESSIEDGVVTIKVPRRTCEKSSRLAALAPASRASSIP
jgi:hypothetical protein